MSIKVRGTTTWKDMLRLQRVYAFQLTGLILGQILLSHFRESRELRGVALQSVRLRSSELFLTYHPPGNNILNLFRWTPYVILELIAHGAFKLVCR
jgi:hypothetical protein